MRLEEGKVYKIDISREPNNAPCGEFNNFESYDGHEVSLDFNIEEELDEAFYYDGWYFSKRLLVKTRKKADRILKKDSRTYTNFKEGDLVKVRTLEDLKQHYYSTDSFIYTKPEKIKLYRNFSSIIGKRAIIRLVDGGLAKLDFLDVKDYHETNVFSTEALEIVEEGYQKRMEEELKAKRVKKEIDVENDEVIKEMLDKVDIEKFNKILSGAFRMKASSLLGVDKLLKDWACAKRELYLALGRNLTIRKSVEYEMSDRDAEERKKILIDSFPRIL